MTDGATVRQLGHMPFIMTTCRAVLQQGAPRVHRRREPGDIVAYRCEDCLDRWDLVLPDEPDSADR